MSAAVTTTIPILAFSPPVVKGGGIEVALHAAGRLVKLTGSEEMFFKFAKSILVSKPAPRAVRAIDEVTLAAYRRVVARVHAGETWGKAAGAEGVMAGSVASWWYRENARRRDAAEGAAILKPSGEIL